MHIPITVKIPNNISEWQMGFNSAFKGLTLQTVLAMSRSRQAQPERNPAAQQQTAANKL
jgi:hypothetical protein